MENPNIQTKVVHSQSKPAWNVVSTVWGAKYKIARFPYAVDVNNEAASSRMKYEALLHAQFASMCFNHSEEIIKTFHF